MPIHDDDAPTPANALSRDRRITEMGRWEAESPMSQRARHIHERIEQIHCRLLERATGGRLTWLGDKIVRQPRPGERSPSTLPTISKLLDNSLTGSTLK